MADIVKGYTFTNGETVTPAKLHALVDDATVADGSITTAKLANSLVTTAKLADAAVTSAKIADGTIVNADISTSANIDGSKIGRNFGSRSIYALGSGGNSTSTAYGEDALYSNTVSGNSNTGIGFAALYNSNGNFNTAVGKSSLQQLTNGLGNTAVGCDSLSFGYTSNSTAIVYQSLYYNTGGVNNTALGSESLAKNQNGNNNTAIGVRAGGGSGGPTNSNTNGTNNTFIGYEAIGLTATSSNTITLGNSAISTLRCQVSTITSLSDIRDKKNVKTISSALHFVKSLRPVSFDWNMRDGSKIDVPEIGFIAQELQQSQVETGFTVPNLVNSENPEKLEAAPGTLIPLLVAAIQELAARVEALEAAKP